MVTVTWMFAAGRARLRMSRAFEVLRTWELAADWPRTGGAVLFLATHAWPILVPDLAEPWPELCRLVAVYVSRTPDIAGFAVVGAVALLMVLAQFVVVVVTDAGHDSPFMWVTLSQMLILYIAWGIANSVAVRRG